MINDSCWLIILLIFAIIFYYSNENNNNQYLINEGFRNSNVYLGNGPIKTNDFLYMNNDDFGSHSIYEVGIVKKPNNNYNGDNSNYYSSYYSDYYSSYV